MKIDTHRPYIRLVATIGLLFYLTANMVEKHGCLKSLIQTVGWVRPTPPQGQSKLLFQHNLIV